MSLNSTLRSFGIGIFVAGASLNVFQMLDDKKPKESTKATEVVAKDSVVMKKAEVQKLNEQIATLEADKKKLQQAAKRTSTHKEPKVKSYVLDVHAGMGTNEVSKALKKAGIIEDSDEFEAYIVNEGKSSTIQLGKTTVTANMTNAEILKALTKRK